MLFTICFLILGAIFDSLFLIFVNNIVVRGKGWYIFGMQWVFLLYFLSFLSPKVMYWQGVNQRFLSIFKCTSVSFMEMV